MNAVGVGSALVVVAAVILSYGGLHKIDEGYVGLYWRGGALLKDITEPGYHTLVPFVTTYEQVQVTIQTDQVKNIPCGTSGGVMLFFDRIEVVNRLQKAFVYDTVKNYTVDYDKFWIFDRVHHEINQFCSVHTLQDIYINKFDRLDEELQAALEAVLVKWSPGIEIISVRVTKPRIPKSIKSNYEAMAATRSRINMVVEKQAVQIKQAETEVDKKKIQAKQRHDVAKIEISKSIRQATAEKEMALKEQEMLYDREKAKADSLFYKVSSEANANQALLTPQYIQQLRSKSLLENSQLIMGDAIPKTLMLGKLKLLDEV